MRTSRRQYPQVNAGSMADIAFLLLIFFLVTAVIPKEDEGFNRKLPPPCPIGEDCSGEIKQRNTLEIRVNSKNELWVENTIVPLEDLKDLTKAFLDNNGDLSCDYCDGLKNEKSSENPHKAVISLTNDKMTSYDFYIKVQDEITKAYYELRSNYAKNVLNKSSNELTKTELDIIKAAYPFVLSEAELKN